MSDVARKLASLAWYLRMMPETIRSNDGDHTLVTDKAAETVEEAVARVRELEAERDAAIARANHALTPECLGTLGPDGYVPNCRRFRAERDALRALLREARDNIQCWGGYASEYFQQKHDLAGDLARIDAALGDRHE